MALEAAQVRRGADPPIGRGEHQIRLDLRAGNGGTPAPRPFEERSAAEADVDEVSAAPAEEAAELRFEQQRLARSRCEQRIPALEPTVIRVVPGHAVARQVQTE